LKYIRVKNWKKHQHYKGRTPPWIKLHAALLDDYGFECLSDINKIQLVAIWLLASRSRDYHPEGDPLLPHDEAYLSKKSGLKSKIDLTPLLSSGFIISYHSASAMLATDKHSAPTDLDLETYKEDKETSIATTPSNGAGSQHLVSWDKTFAGITPDMVETWTKAYPACDIPQHLYRMDQWLLSNPAKAHKKNFYRFITNWLSKSQEKGGR
jgi:hypothetical protein